MVGELGSWHELVGINAKLRDDSEIAAVSFRAQNAADFLAAGKRVIGVMQDVGLDPGEGRRIAAPQILPREEKCLRAGMSRGAQREKGGKVVRFFIDVNDVRLYAVDDRWERGVIVEMELSNETHRLNAQRIAVRVRAFEWDRAALVAPKGWNDDGQFNAGLLGEFFQFDLILSDDASLADHENAHIAIIN